MNVLDLPGLFFLDTNIFVYSFDATAPQKQQTARNLIHNALGTQRGVISAQVVQEFLNVALRKFTQPMTITESRDYLKITLLPLCRHYPSALFYDRALLLKEATGFSFYDSLIVAAAVDMGCSTLLSEDLQDGRTVQGVKIINPFTWTA
jgi:predicted nucleic acid-binding protein